MGNAFRRSPAGVFVLILGIVYGVIVTVMTVSALIAARVAPDISTVRDVLVVLGTGVVAGFLIFPLAFGVDDTFDPRKFALFGIPNRVLSRGMLLAGLIGLPAFMLIVCSAATVVTWSRTAASTVTAAVCAVLIVLICVLASRVSTALASLLRATPRSRTTGGTVTIALLVLLVPVILLLVTVDGGRNNFTALSGVASWLSWTPFGAVWSAPGAIAAGDISRGLTQLVIAMVTAGLLWIVWNALVRTVLVTPSRQARLRLHHGAGWFEWLRGGPIAAVAARSMTYWGRDPRYWVSFVMIPVIPVLVIAVFVLAGLPVHYVSLVPLPLVCLFLGWSVHNDVAFDGTAVWLHVVSGTRGIADRVGRMFPLIVIGVPVVAIGSIVTVFAFGDWTILPAVVALSSAILMIGLGLSSISSVLFPYPATKPGDSAFTQPQSSGTWAALVQAVSFCAILILASPPVAFLVMGLVVDPFWLGVSLAAAVFIGVATLLGGLWAGARLFDRRGPELMAFATRNA